LGGELIKDASSFGFEIFAFDKDELDVTDESQIRQKIKEINPDILINTTAYNAVAKCEIDPSPAMELNFIAVQNLTKLCKENNIVFVTYSTDYVFDGKKGKPYEENDIPNPLQAYGSSKLKGEYAALSIYPKGTFLIRTCGLYGGKRGSPEKGNFVLNIMNEAQEKEVIEVSSEQIASPTYAGDLSKATLKLLGSKAEPGIYHLISEGHCSWYMFAKEIFRLEGIKKEISPVDRGGSEGAMQRPKFSALKNTKAKAMGIELPSWQEGLRSYINFLKQ